MDIYDPYMHGDLAEDQNVENLAPNVSLVYPVAHRPNAPLVYYEDTSSSLPLEPSSMDFVALESVDEAHRNQTTSGGDSSSYQLCSWTPSIGHQNECYPRLLTPSDNSSYAFEIGQDLQVPNANFLVNEGSTMGHLMDDQESEDPCYGFTESDPSLYNSTLNDSLNDWPTYEDPSWLVVPVHSSELSTSHHFGVGGPSETFQHFGPMQPRTSTWPLFQSSGVPSDYTPKSPLPSHVSLSLLSEVGRGDGGSSTTLGSPTKARSDSTSKYVCRHPECSRHFNRPSELRKHEKVHLEECERPYKCDREQCSAGFIYRKDLERHIRSKHASRRETQLRYYCPNQSCQLSVKGFTRKDKLIHHWKKLHGNEVCPSGKDISCEEPKAPPSSSHSDHGLFTENKYTFQRSRSSSLHSRAVSTSRSLHDDTSEKMGPSTPHDCSLNDDLGQQRPSYNETVKIDCESRKHKKRDVRIFSCDVPGCRRDKGFGTQHDLRRHKRTVHDLPTFSSLDRGYTCASEKCPTASKTWPRLDNLRQHVLKMHCHENPNDLIRRCESNKVDAFPDSSSRPDTTLIFSSYHPPIEQPSTDETKHLIY